MADGNVSYEGPIVTRRAAQAAGLIHYFTGKPCPYGHIDKKYVKGKVCFSCMRRIAKTRAQHSDYRLRRTKRRNTPEAIAKAKEARAAYYAANRAKILARKKKYRESVSGKEAIRVGFYAWLKTEAGRAYSRFRTYKRRALLANAVCDFTKEDDKKLRERHKKCHICLKRFTKSDPPTLDHVIALARGGAHTASNIALAHLSCNARKHAHRTHLL